MTASDLKGVSQAIPQVIIGVLIALGVVFFVGTTGGPKVIQGVDITVRSDGSTSYTRQVVYDDQLVWGYGEVRQPGAEKALCWDTWAHTYQISNPITTDRDINWMIGDTFEHECPLPLPVGARWKFTFTPNNPSYSKTVIAGEVIE